MSKFYHVLGVAIIAGGAAVYKLWGLWGDYWTTEPKKEKTEYSEETQGNHRNAYHEEWSGRHSTRNDNSGARTRHTNYYSNPINNHGEGWSGRHSSRNNNNSGARTQMLRHMNYSNPNNNHDHQKQSHASCEEAEFEAARMQRHNPGDTFNAYFNKERDSWYVGRSKYE